MHVEEYKSSFRRSYKVSTCGKFVSVSAVDESLVISMYSKFQEMYLFVFDFAFFF